MYNAFRDLHMRRNFRGEKRDSRDFSRRWVSSRSEVDSLEVCGSRSYFDRGFLKYLNMIDVGGAVTRNCDETATMPIPSSTHALCLSLPECVSLSSCGSCR